jgi:hypothetical protein
MAKSEQGKYNKGLVILPMLSVVVIKSKSKKLSLIFTAFLNSNKRISSVL